MASLGNLSIRTKLLTIIMLTTGAALVLSGVLFFCYENISYRSEIVGKYDTLANILCKEIATSLVSEEPISANETLHDLGKDPHIKEVAVYNQDGQLFASYLRKGVNQPNRPPHTLQKYHLFENRTLTMQQPVVSDRRPVGSIWIQTETTELYERLSQFVRIIISALLLSILFAFFISSRLQRVISKPLQHLTDTAQRVSHDKNYSIRAANQSDDELGILTRSFNNMLEQIQNRDLELELHRDNLENEVSIRTGELVKMNEDLIKAKERAVTAVKTKSEFLANMSHEIRTPMNGIIGITDLALTHELDSQLREYLNMIMKSAESLLAIINDILDFSKIEAGRLNLSPDNFELREFVHNTVKMLAIRSCQKGLELSYYISPNVPDRLFGDVGRLGQILINLIGNSIKFTDRGEVCVTIELAFNNRLVDTLSSQSAFVDISSEEDDDIALLFSVRDTGIGIPRHKQGKVFEAFSQADGSTTRSFGGTGLGLAICSLLVKIMGGKIWVDSEPNRGSKFSFTTKLKVAADSAGEENPAQSPLAMGSEIYLVQNDSKSRAALQRTIQEWGVKVICFDSDSAVLTKLNSCDQDHYPSLLVLDFQHADSSSLEIIDSIRQQTCLEIPIVVLLPATASNEISVKAKQIRYSGCLNKPVLINDLYEIVQRFLGQGDSDDQNGFPQAS